MLPSDEDTTDFEITMSEEDERPPDYSQASRFPVSELCNLDTSIHNGTTVEHMTFVSPLQSTAYFPPQKSGHLK